MKISQTLIKEENQENFVIIFSYFEKLIEAINNQRICARVLDKKERNEKKKFVLSFQHFIINWSINIAA